MVCNWLGTEIYFMCTGTPKQEVKGKQWIPLVLFSVVFSLNITIGNFSTMMVSVSFNQVRKRAMLDPLVRPNADVPGNLSFGLEGETCRWGGDRGCGCVRFRRPRLSWRDATRAPCWSSLVSRDADEPKHEALSFYRVTTVRVCSWDEGDCWTHTIASPWS